MFVCLSVDKIQKFQSCFCTVSPPPSLFHMFYFGDFFVRCPLLYTVQCHLFT